MCGIGGIASLERHLPPGHESALTTINTLLAHRGPDGAGTWVAENRAVAFAHRRLSIIDVGEGNTGAQPMHGQGGLSITFNGEIYNYPELRTELSDRWTFRTRSDTETILAAYDRWGDNCVSHMRGMFSFALWDNKRQRLFCARDPFGIKPFYYTLQNGNLFFASEAKALLPFLPNIQTDPSAFAEYITFQYTLSEQTMFRGIKQLMPGHVLVLESGKISTRRYWDVVHRPNNDLRENEVASRFRGLLADSIQLHLRSDVPVGTYLSGGVDSSLIAILASSTNAAGHKAFHGRFLEYPGYDESDFARLAAQRSDSELCIEDITAQQFRDNIARVIYHLDFPVAGPGSFPQFMVSKFTARNVKVVLGGQGGDEMFGGYARYVIAYLEHCLNLALHGKYDPDTLPVSMQALMPNLGVLREYVPLMRQTWGPGLFDPLNRQYFRLVDRSTDLHGEINWAAIGESGEDIFSRFDSIFSNRANTSADSTFDAMTHFEFKSLLPALLQVEDRMSMAHGLESRVPFLDVPIAEFAAAIPERIKFAGGEMKHVFRTAFDQDLPTEIANRRDKMGFAVPLNEWFQNELKDFVSDTFNSSEGRTRDFLNTAYIRANLESDRRFSRKTWGMLSLELWHQQFHDQAAKWRAMGLQ